MLAVAVRVSLCWVMLGLTQLANYLTLKGLFSAGSKKNVASKYALERSRRDLQNALICIVFGIHNRKPVNLPQHLARLAGAACYISNVYVL